MKQEERKDDYSTLRAAGAMGVAVLLSRLLGLVRIQAFAILFGAGDAMDAFNVAFRIPNMLRSLFAEGALNSALIPVFIQARHEGGERRAWQVAGLVFRGLTALVAVISLLGFFLAWPLVGAFAPTFHDIPGKFELTVHLSKMLLPYFPLVALAAAFMGILNACGSFFLPALSAPLFNLFSIVIGVFFAQFFGRYALGFQPIEGMAIGVVAGGLASVLFQLRLLKKVGYRFSAPAGALSDWLFDPALKKILFLMVPAVLGLSATQVGVVINTMLATSAGPGAVSWLNYAFRLMQFPLGVIGVSLAQANTPLFSRLWIQKDDSGMKAALDASLKQLLATHLPASVGLAVLGRPIIELLFQYGQFHASDTQATALALAMYSIGLTAYSAVKLLVPVCYAMGNARIAVWASVISMGITTVLNLISVRFLGYWGLPLGTSIGAIANTLILLLWIRRRIRPDTDHLGFFYGPLLKAFAIYSGISVVMGVLVHFSYEAALGALPGDSVWIRALRLALVLAEGVGAVVAMAFAFHEKELSDAIRLALKKLGLSRVMR